MTDYERNLKIRDILNDEGTGSSVWGVRDCITLVRAAIRALSGQEPSFRLPDWADGLGEQQVIERAPGEHGSVRKGWLHVIDAEPLLRKVKRGTAPSPGMIGLTTVEYHIDATSTAKGPLLGVFGPDGALWVRTHKGLRRAWPVLDKWEVIEAAANGALAQAPSQGRRV